MTTNDQREDNEFRYGRPIEPKPVDYAHLDNRRSRFILAALLALASPFLVDWLTYGILEALGGPSLLAPLLLGLPAAKLGLLVIWLAWGGGLVIFRMLIAIASLLLTCLVLPKEPDSARYFMGVFLILLLCSAFVAMPRWFGVRWRVSDESDVVTHRPRQFSIRDMLVWTVVAAIVAGVCRWINIMPEHARADELLPALLIMLMVIAGCAAYLFACMWVTLGTRGSQGGPVAALYGVTLFLSLFLGGLLGRGGSEAIGYVFGFFMSTLTCLVIAFLQLRKHGHRLVLSKHSPLAPSDRVELDQPAKPAE